jgi:magnesium-transporting ATPase (P-type)
MAEGVVYNCSARIEINDRGMEEVMGNCTEQGLIRFLLDMKVPCNEMLLGKGENTLTFIPFNSSRKRACTAIRHPDDKNLVRVFCKGAPEIVFNYVSKTFDAKGDVVDLNDQEKSDIVTNIIAKTFAVKAFRTLLIAYTDYTYEEFLKLKYANNNFEKESDREALE